MTCGRWTRWIDCVRCSAFDCEYCDPALISVSLSLSLFPISLKIPVLVKVEIKKELKQKGKITKKKNNKKRWSVGHAMTGSEPVVILIRRNERNVFLNLSQVFHYMASHGIELHPESMNEWLDRLIHRQHRIWLAQDTQTHGRYWVGCNAVRMDRQLDYLPDAGLLNNRTGSS